MNIKSEKVLDKDLVEATIKGCIAPYFESVCVYDGELAHEYLLIQAHIAMALYKKAAREGNPVPPMHYSDIDLANNMTRKLFKHLSEYVLELDFDKI